MRLLVVGRLSGQLATAVKMAMAHGAKVQHVERGDQATEQLRRGQGADLLMVDYRVDIAALIAALDVLDLGAVRHGHLHRRRQLSAEPANHQKPHGSSPLNLLSRSPIRRPSLPS